MFLMQLNQHPDLMDLKDVVGQKLHRRLTKDEQQYIRNQVGGTPNSAVRGRGSTPSRNQSEIQVTLSATVTCCLRLSLTHTHTTLISTLHYTCGYDEIKGTQDLKIYSHADSLILSHT